MCYIRENEQKIKIENKNTIFYKILFYSSNFENNKLTEIVVKTV